MRRALTREDFIPLNSEMVDDTESSAVAYKFSTQALPFCLKIFKGRRAKPSVHLYFHTAQRRDDHIEQYFQTVRKEEERKRVHDARLPHDLSIGDILYTSGGYEQTNVDFYEIVAVTDKSIKICEVDKESRASGDMTCYSKALPGKFVGEPKMIRAAKRGDGVLVAKVGTRYAMPDDGSEKYESFYG